MNAVTPIMEKQKENIKKKYAGMDSEILSHGQNYFLTASRIYKTLKPADLYPLLTLLGLSAELFFKAFHIALNEEYFDHGDGLYSLVNKTVKTLNNGKDENGKFKHNGHKLEHLFEHFLDHDKELFDYLIMSYQVNTKRDLKEDLLKFSVIFERSRYIFEHETKEYISDIDTVFNLVKSLYNSITTLYEE